MTAPAAASPNAVGRDEGGFMLPMLCLLLVTVVVSAALAVDVGGWYARAAQIQRGVDAAALAGVVWMPDFPAAQTAALATAARNGFTPGGNITITVSPEPGNSRQLTVAITDAKAPRHFSGFVGGDQSLSRTATAEYVLPVPLGSPKNTFGTGDLLSGANRENFWAAVNGYCAGHESGDLKLARYESYTTSTGGAAQCNNGSAQTGDYDPAGYLYAIEMPQAAAGAAPRGLRRRATTRRARRPTCALTAESQAVTTVVRGLRRRQHPPGHQRQPAAVDHHRRHQLPPLQEPVDARCTRGSTRPPAPTTSG